MSDIEEEGLRDEEYVPEDAVAKIIDMKVDSTQRTTQWSTIQGVRDCPCQSQLRKRRYISDRHKNLSKSSNDTHAAVL